MNKVKERNERKAGAAVHKRGAVHERDESLGRVGRIQWECERNTKETAAGMSTFFMVQDTKYAYWFNLPYNAAKYG